MDIECCGNFLIYIKVILMNSPNGHYVSPNAAFITGTLVYPVDLLIKGVPWKSLNNPDCF